MSDLEGALESLIEKGYARRLEAREGELITIIIIGVHKVKAVLKSYE